MGIRRRTALFVVAILTATLGLAPLASAAVPTDSSGLRTAVTAAGILDHLNALQAIGDANGGERTSGTPGYDASVDYVVQRLEAAGYDPVVQDFEFPFFREISSHFERVSPDPEAYASEVDYLTMTYSGSGDATAELVPVDLVIPPGPTAGTSTSGCEASDFTGLDVAGKVALIQRGTCTFATKAANAQAAGAAGVIIFNEGQPGRQALFGGTLGGPGIGIPVVSISFALGEELYNLSQGGPVTVHLQVSTENEIRTTSNVIAETPGGRNDRVVVAGAHLDSVIGTVAMNDNGSGSAALLEIAEQFSALNIQPRNKVRFIWFGAEEFGLLGSDYYVSQLSTRDIKNIAANINVDMIASDNYVRFVYDGGDGPNGSNVVENVFLDYFGSQGLATDPTPLAGSSDYAPFMEAGIPVGGVFAGASGLKTADQAAVYGGTADLPYYECYHLACDRVGNVSSTVLEQLSDGAAHAILSFAMTTSAVNGTGRANGNALESLEFRGPNAQR